MSKIIGIDLGTTNSVVSFISGGEAEVITNEEGDRITPSIVGFAENGEILVGQQARNQMITNPENTIRSAKRFMGRKYEEVSSELRTIPYKVISGSNGDVRIKTRNGEFAPPQISALILKKIKESAEQFLGEKVEKAVITVPAYFNDAQRQATKDAGTIAGLEVVRIINEPTAAALAYGLDKKGSNLKIAVFDFGGGTFDISLLELDEGFCEVKSTSGDTHLGGDDIDQILIDFLIDEFKKANNIDLSQDPVAIQRLKDAAERAKKELSTMQNSQINLPFISSVDGKPLHLNTSISRSKFENLIDPLLQRLEIPCQDALKSAGLSVSDIDEIILVGGSTRIPKVEEVVKNIFKKAPSKKINPDEVVSVGAAVQGGVLAGDVKDILLLDVTPLSLGIETLGGVFTKIIEKNTTIPSKKSQVFSTAEDNQNAVSIRVFQGERSMASDNKMIGQFDLIGIPPAKRGMPQIEVTFDIDANGILNVSAKDLGTGKEQSIRIQASSGLSEDEIQKMTKDAEVFAEEDRKKREIVDLMNKLDGLIFQTESTLSEAGEKVPADKRASIEALIAEGKEATKTQEKVKMEAIFEKLTKEIQDISQHMGQGVNPEQPTQNENQSSQDKTVEEGDFEVK